MGHFFGFPAGIGLACAAVNAHALSRVTTGATEPARGKRVDRARPRRAQRREDRAQRPEPTPDPESEPESNEDSGGKRWKRVLAGAESLMMLAATAAAAAVLANAWETGQTDERVVAGVTLAGQDISGMTRAEVAAVAAEAGERTLDRALTLTAGPASTVTSARALGALPDASEAVEQALALGRSGDIIHDLRARAEARGGAVDLRIGMRFEQARALEQLLELAPAVDTMSLPTRLDLEARKVLPAERGTALLPYDSLSNVALGLAAGSDTIELAVAHKAPVDDVLVARLQAAGFELDALDVGVVLGSFSTPYSMEAKAADRTVNLKVGAAILDGHVILPGETFSFNEVVGARSAENGYRWAPGISGGQIIDVLGGGICQVASTVFGAAFFSGLEIVRARPHSRPSSYVDMGLDATVVWDTVDLEFRNDLDFPIVLHMNVSQGQVRAEILGPQRPYQVAFERSLVESMDYETVYRSDPKLLTGAEVVAQRGRRGFKLERVRKRYRGGEVVDEERWDLVYPATREIIRVGDNPAGVTPEAKKLPPLRDPVATMRIMQ